MNKLYKIFKSAAISSAIAFLLFNPAQADATVGGPSTIYDLRYNPINESVYYIVIDGGGRGCPPVLKKMSLATGDVETVFSCEQGEALIGDNWYNGHLVNIEIKKITDPLKSLTQIHLKENDIDVDVNYLRENRFGDDDQFVISRAFSADVLQNGNIATKLEIQACNIKEPFIFDGYAIPGFEQKIILMMSAKADCFEGGYVSDSIYVVGGVNNLKKDYYPNRRKGASSITPNEGSLVVYEPDSPKISSSESSADEDSQDTMQPSQENHQTQDDETDHRFNWNLIAVVLAGALLFLVVLGLGFLIGKKNRV